MADVGFLQALRGALAGQLGQTQADAGGGTVHTWQPVPKGPPLSAPGAQMEPPANLSDPGVRSFGPPPVAQPPSGGGEFSGAGFGGGFGDAMSAGDALFHRLGPAFDPVMSGMRTAFGLGPGQPTGNQAPTPPILSQTQPISPTDAPWYTPPDPNTRSFGPPPTGIGSFGQFPQQPHRWQ